jgi:hypothetical protein
MRALQVQAGGLGTVTKTVEDFGGFAKQYEQIEKVSAHHGNFWEVPLYSVPGPPRRSPASTPRQSALPFSNWTGPGPSLRPWPTWAT